jgi:hypothetical protein
MNLCAQLQVYGAPFYALLGMALTMLALSRIAKKHREETAYTVFVGLSSAIVANLVIPEVFNSAIELVHMTNQYGQAIYGGAVAAVAATVLLMLLGKPLKVKAVAPKILFICFFLGLGLANIVEVALHNQCHAPRKASKQS